nr:hypothetical protein [Tanacetum cinerariifolium]
MAGLKSSSMLVVFVMMMVASSTMAQTSHVVGGSLGWTIPSSNGVYGTWASGQTFNVGDSLEIRLSVEEPLRAGFRGEERPAECKALAGSEMTL